MITKNRERTRFNVELKEAWLLDIVQEKTMEFMISDVRRKM